MHLNKRKKKKLSFWSHFNKVNLVVPKSLGLKYKKRFWRRFLFSSAFWKKKALSSFKLNEMTLNSSRIKNLLKAHVLS